MVRKRISHLFNPILIAGKKLPNRIVMGPYISGYAGADGFVNNDLITYLSRRARGGAGLLITEAVRVVAPAPDDTHNHLGIYADAFIPQWRHLAYAVQNEGGYLMITLDEPASAAEGSSRDLHELGKQFIQAAWRALAAGCDGIMLTAADGGVLHTLLSPQHNRRLDAYGGSLTERLKLSMSIVEGIRQWLGNRLIIGFRLLAEDFNVNGIKLQDARVIARRITGSGVHLLDVTADTHNTLVPIARFPGWSVPLVESIKRINPDVPVICSGLFGDPHLADSIIRDGSADLIMLNQTLRTDPDWPKNARKILTLDT